MTIIDPRYVDVDLDAEARRLGFIPGDTSRDNPLEAMHSYGDEFEILPDAQRKAAIEKLDAEGGIERLIRWVLNQGNEGSCVGQMETQGVQVVGAKQFGESKIVPLSACSAYKQIGSSPNSGANIGDALDKGMEVGILPLDTPENRVLFGAHVMPATGFRTPWPEGWQVTARQFRITKHLAIRSVAEAEQAGINGHPIGVGRNGHSILYIRPSLRSGRGFIYVNSWGRWGFAIGGLEYGFGFDSARTVDSATRWAFAFCSVSTPDYVLAL